jgi:hypothetical protein
LFFRLPRGFTGVNLVFCWGKKRGFSRIGYVKSRKRRIQGYAKEVFTLLSGIENKFL